MKFDSARVLAALLGAVLAFSVLASGGHDLWAATIVHACALALFAALLWASRRANDGLAVDAPLLALLGPCAAAFTLSFFGSVHPEESRLALMDWLSALLIFLTARHVFRDGRRRDFVFAAVALLICVETSVIVYQHWTLALAPGAPHGLRKMLLLVLSMQLPGTLVNSSAATAFFLLWIPVFAGLILQRRRENRSVPVFWLVGLVGSVFGLLLLDSNWGMVCALAAAPWIGGVRWPIERLRRRPRAAAAILCAAAAAFVALLAWKFGHSQNLNGEPLPPGETTRRLYWWLSGLKMFIAHPWLGVGLGNFPSAYLAFKAGTPQNTLYPHNLIVGLLAETGITGAGALFFAIGGLIWRWVRDCDAPDSDWPYLLGFLSFTLFGMMGLTIEYLANLLCASVILGAFSSKWPRVAQRPRLSLAVLFTAAAICAIPYLISPWMASVRCVNGFESLRTGDSAGAIRAFSSAAELDALSADARHGWALALLARHRTTGDPAALDAAIVRQREAVALDRLNSPLNFELSGLLRLRAWQTGR